MNIFHKTQKKETRKLPMTGKVRKGFRYYCAAVLSLTAIFAMSTTAFAASDPLTVVNNLSDFIFGFIRAFYSCDWTYPARFWYRSGRSFAEIPRSFAACKRISDAGGRYYHRICKRNPHSDYGLTFTLTTYRGVPGFIFRNTPFSLRRCYENE